MIERTEALALAERLLDEPNADPDDDLRILSRQLLRRQETVERLQNKLAELQDGTLDMIHANRDTILRIHEEAIARIHKLLEGGLAVQCHQHNAEGVLEGKATIALKVIEAANVFHPMHGESWPGWPEGSEL